MFLLYLGLYEIGVFNQFKDDSPVKFVIQPFQATDSPSKIKRLMIEQLAEKGQEFACSFLDKMEGDSPFIDGKGTMVLIWKEEC